MAQYTAYAQYYIYFRSQTEYNAAIAQYGAAFIGASPQAMGRLLGITNFTTTISDRGITSVEYALTGIGTEIKHPLPSGLFMNPAVNSTLVPGQFGGDDLRLTWAGIIVKAPSNAVPTTTVKKRRWGGGFEVAMTGEGGTSLSSARAGCKDASRFTDGLGWAFRNETGITLLRSLSEYGAPTLPVSSWERIYLRLRTAPTSSTNLWNSVDTISPSIGMFIGINADRTIRIQSRNASSVFTTQVAATALALNLNQWYRFDILVKYGATTPTFQLYVNQVQIVNIGGPGGNAHDSSVLGDTSGGGTNGIEIDFDEWENAELPDLTSLNSIDWLNGTRYKKVDVVSGTSAWVPATEVQSFNQMISPVGSNIESQYTSSTALARLDGLTNVTLKTIIEDLTGFSLGVISAVIGLFSSRVGGNGQLGYKLAGAAPTLTTIVQGAGTIFNTVMYTPGGSLALVEASPFSVVHDKGNTATASLVLALQAVIGYIGIFGNEDNSQYIAGFTRKPLTHNSSGPNTLYGVSGPYPNGNCASIGGLYTGNGTTQEINLPFLPHFIWIRNIGVTTNGVCHWQAAGLGSHFGGTERVVPDFAIRVWVDNGQPKITIAGNNSQINQLAATYQYVAFCDPGMRYCVCGSWRHQTSLSSAINLLQNGLFTPEMTLFQSDLINVNSSVVKSALKGPGNTVNAGTLFDGTAQANFMTFGVGQLTSLANTHIAASQANYSAWRTNDGSVSKRVQIFTYTGNGAASRVIPLTPTSGKAPLLVIVQAINGVLYFRDPSHAGANSSQFTLSNSITAITAVGVDTMTVGITLNANAVVYNVFTIIGDSAAMVNGTFYAPSVLPPTDAWFGGVQVLTPNLSGIYTLTPGATHDTYTDFSDLSQILKKIPDPLIKTGYISG